MSELPAVRLRALTAADISVLSSWGGSPERFLGITELLEAAAVPGTITWLAETPQGHVVAVFQAAPEEDGARSVALLVHPGCRGAGYGTACVRAAMSEPWLADVLLTATIDRANAASLRCFTRCGFRADNDASSRTYACLSSRRGREHSVARADESQIDPSDAGVDHDDRCGRPRWRGVRRKTILRT